MDEKIHAVLEEFNRISSLPFKLRAVDPHEIKLLDKNARYMSNEMFRNLVDNLRRDGVLTSIPLCYKYPDGPLLVISGNHRVQAAVQAGLESILCFVIERELSRQELVAIQLSHNAIEGKDDPVILKELWGEIEEMDLKLYAGLDSELLKELEKLEFTPFVETRPDFKQAVFLFLPEETEELQKLLADMDMLFSGDESYILSRRHFDDVFAAVADMKEKFNIVNNPTALMKVIELAKERLEEIKNHAT